MTRDELAREEAGQWFAIMRRGAMTLEERQAFDQWRTDTTNQRALDRMHELWGELAILKSASPPIARSPARHRARVMAASIAATLVVAGGAFGLHHLDRTQVATGIGEQQTQALPDGSIMAVNVDSRVRLALANPRRIRIDRGEAAFFVRSDAGKPFVVTVGAYDIRAIGTAFNVRWRGGATEVAVREGVVAIVDRKNGREIVRLRAGEVSNLSFNPAKANPAVSSIPVASVAQWRMRVIEYDNVPVQRLIDELNRFYDRPLRVAEPDFANQLITVRLQVEDRDRTLKTVAGLLNATIETGPVSDTLKSSGPLSK